MPGEDAITGTLNDPMDQKGRTRHRWREKLPRWDSKATQDDRSRNQDIQSFLHAPNNEQAVVTTSDLGSPPKISSPDEKYVSNHVSPSPSRRKSPRKPDLHVEFAATAPVIIGEGGDEAALPVTELLSSLALFSNLPVEASEAGIQPLVTVFEQVHVKEQSNPDNSFRPKSLERRSTGLRDHDSNVHPMQAAEPTSWRRDQAMPRDDVPGILPAQSTRRDSPGGQQNALVNGNPIDGTAPTSHIDTLDVEWPRGDGGRQESSSAPLQLNLLDPATSFANSLSPLPSPQPRRSPYSSSDSSPSFAATQITDILPSNSAYTKVADSKAQHLPQGISASPLVEARDLSLRNIVKGFAEDALLEFASRVRPYCSVFLLGLGSGIEPTLQQWVIAATWWFLKGRIELENSVRSRPRSIAAQDPTQVDIPRELKQAFIDLAKSWWIVTEMAPARHPEVRRLENRGPVSLPTIMHSFVDARTTELIQAYHSIVSNLRALTMSMKRNSKLPPHGMELQGLDVRIFVAYPSLSPSAARLLSLENLKIVAGDRPAETASFFPMPIADTERHFNYGRMFVDLVINEGNTGHQISMPCLLSMLRDKKKRDISVVVASQDGQVQLFIQPEANTPISWQDVHWKVQHRAIEIDVRADFIVRIQLSERDFKTVWGVHDYTRSVQKQSQGLKDEVLIYEKILRSFQYLEGGNGAAQFPTEPVKGCKLRLFECFTIATEGVGRRKTHDGYRLMVVTPRSVKTLNSVNRDIGRQLPIVFNFLRDERKAPALLLKMSKSSRDPSMVMSFEQEADREHFYSLLNGTKMSIDEFCSDILPLKHCGVSTDMEQEPASNNQIRILDRLHWQRLQVLGQRGQQMELGGPVTRICAECDMGSLVDRINIGISMYSIFRRSGF